MTEKRVQVSFTYNNKRYYIKAPTKAEANRKAGEKLAELKRGHITESTISLNSWFKEYMDVYKSSVTNKTKKDYQNIYKNAIEPELGKMPLKAIRQIQCRKLLNNLFGKSSSYVHKVFILLNGSLEAAVDNDLLSKNPMRGLKEPEAYAGQRRSLTPSERETFLMATNMCGNIGYYGKIVYFCGLRPSEALRVKAEDFDRQNRILKVRGTKTKASLRSVPVPKALDLPDKKTGALFKTCTGKEIDKNGQRRYWLTIVRAMEKISGRPIAEDLTMYCLRHDFGTRCIEAGIDIETVSKIMGHSNVAITSKIYLHESEITLNNALNKMNALYG